MKFFPGSALEQLEFNKVKSLLASHCRLEPAAVQAEGLRIHTKKEFIEIALQQAHEFKALLQSGQYFPNDFVRNVQRELKLIAIPGSALSGEQFILIRKLAENAGGIFRWFDEDHRQAFPALAAIIKDLYFEKAILQKIDEVLDETGTVKDRASEELANIRMALFRKRNELRRVFDKIVQKLNKQGYLTDIEESFMNGRRVLAVFAEQKRMVKGVLHSESDSRRTSFIEPEETTELNNEIFTLEYEEQKEVTRILRQLTEQMRIHAPLLVAYFNIAIQFDFTRAKALLAVDMGASMPAITDGAQIGLTNAVHPLLFLYNKRSGNTTVPVDLKLAHDNRILVISGPNAGGKTVAMKTVALLQVMLQAGLLVSAGAESNFGIFKQLFIQIGDEQSLEFELSTYSSHLKNMKYFIENANGKTLFFIDELGSGSDPNLGGAFAEVIMEELARKQALGIVTTHYLNLKVMANKVPGLVNAAMLFDEKNLLPLYKLQVGKPGSSYTFSIAERIGLDKKLIDRARKMVNEDHFTLDRLLNRTEQDLQKIDNDKKELQQLIRDNSRMQKELEKLMQQEQHRQEIEKQKHQNKMAEDKLAYLKDMERKLKALVIEWRKSENKTEVVKMIQALLFKQKEKMVQEKQQKLLNEKYEETGGAVKVGDKVRLKNTRTVGVVKEIKGKNAILQVGLMPITVGVKDLKVVVEKLPT